MPIPTHRCEPIAMHTAGVELLAMPGFGDTISHALTWCEHGAMAPCIAIVLPSLGSGLRVRQVVCDNAWGLNDTIDC